MKPSFVLCGLLMMMALSGCATYQDPVAAGLPAEKTAMVEQPETLNDYVYICGINGKDCVGFYARFEVPLGRNTVTVRGNTSNGMYSDPTVLTFTAEEGHTYVLKYETSPSGHIWDPTSWKGRGTYHAWLEDKATGKKVDEDSLQLNK